MSEQNAGKYFPYVNDYILKHIHMQVYLKLPINESFYQTVTLPLRHKCLYPLF